MTHCVALRLISASSAKPPAGEKTDPFPRPLNGGASYFSSPFHRCPTFLSSKPMKVSVKDTHRLRSRAYLFSFLFFPLIHIPPSPLLPLTPTYPQSSPSGLSLLGHCKKTLFHSASLLLTGCGRLLPTSSTPCESVCARACEKRLRASEFYRSTFDPRTVKLQDWDEGFLCQPPFAAVNKSTSNFRLYSEIIVLHVTLPGTPCFSVQFSIVFLSDWMTFNPC